MNERDEAASLEPLESINRAGQTLYAGRNWPPNARPPVSGRSQWDGAEVNPALVEGRFPVASPEIRD